MAVSSVVSSVSALASLAGAHPVTAAAVAALESQGFSIEDPQIIVVDDDDGISVYDDEVAMESGAPPVVGPVPHSYGLRLTRARAEGACLTRQARSLPNGTASLQATVSAKGWTVIPVDAAGAALSAGWLVAQDPADYAISVTAI